MTTRRPSDPEAGEYRRSDPPTPLDHASRRIAKLEAEVARLTAEQARLAPGHTDMMVPPETLDAWLDANPLPIPSPPAEEDEDMSIPDVDRTAIFSPRAALARIAELEASRDHYRTAGDSATLRASQLTERNDYQAKRIAELGAENTRAYEAGKADGLAEARPAVLAAYARIAELGEELAAANERIAELEAERDRLQEALRLKYGDVLVERDKLKAAQPFDIVAHLLRQIEWSEKTFGPGRRTNGVIDHIRKELAEIEADPLDLKEWVDVIILAYDGAWRAGWKPEAIIEAIVAKQAKNEARIWPDWRTMSEDVAIEHDRSARAALSGEGVT